ncbi:MAG: PQQ-dependent dehydrogenase, methanol/ethanol family [Alphaproteobacteria bacterium]|nr:PQQ-dependent dehydrogenase, methanol/ethanol family [Alphaproteobacteria bacterium]
MFKNRCGLLVVLLICFFVNNTLYAQTLEDVTKNSDPSQYGLGHNLNRFSVLEQVNRNNVGNLVPVWNFSLGDNRGQEANPLMRNGKLFITSHNATYAIDARTGHQIWKAKHEYPKETLVCCGIVNRGAALYKNLVIRVTMDGFVVALDALNGKQVWKAKAAKPEDGYSMTLAPLIANDVVITGVSGGEFGVRGYIDGWEPNTGNHLWRFYTIPSPNEPGGDTWPGDTWKRGGGPTWLTGSYDPELDIVYWGVGNPSPWNPSVRKGDNLYTNSMLALKPKTGRLVWHYQFTPNDAFDYDGVNEPVLTELDIDGKTHKVLMQANRNGFFYVLDRVNGKLLKANPFVSKITWANGIDLKTGRPILSERTKNLKEKGDSAEIWPSAFGGKNWAGMSFSPKTGLAYVNTFNRGWKYTPFKPEFKPGVFYIGMDFEWLKTDGPTGYLKAIDPLTGKSKWEVPSSVPMNGGVLSTAGNLVFSGSQTGELYAFDSQSGDVLWYFKTGSGIIAPPTTYILDGVQYIAVMSGLGGAYAPFSGDKNLKEINPGGSLWVFALTSTNAHNTSKSIKGESILLKQIDTVQVVKKTKRSPLSASAKKGRILFNHTCSHCHGINRVTSGSTTYDLRTFPKSDKNRFINSVLNGKGLMPAWNGKLDNEEVEQLFSYVISD